MFLMLVILADRKRFVSIFSWAMILAWASKIFEFKILAFKILNSGFWKRNSNSKAQFYRNNSNSVPTQTLFNFSYSLALAVNKFRGK